MIVQRRRLTRRVAAYLGLVAVVLACILVATASTSGPALAQSGSNQELNVAPEPQRLQQPIKGDSGINDCLVASVFMALRNLQEQGKISGAAVAYEDVRSAFRAAVPGNSKISAYLAPQEVHDLTAGQAEASEPMTHPEASWQEWTSDQLRQGHPIVAIVENWLKLSPSGHPTAEAGYQDREVHAIVISGLHDGQVFYDDPWDGKRYGLPTADFANAWGPNYWAITVQPAGANNSGPPTSTYTISGSIYIDSNGNGQTDSGESPSAGTTVALSGASSASAVTDRSGAYKFANLQAGSYVVTLSVASGFETTTTNPVNIQLNGPATADFGLRQTPSQLAYVSPEGDLWVENVDGTEAHKIVDGPVARPVWSHDGKKIAYLRVDPTWVNNNPNGPNAARNRYLGGTSVEVVNSDGSNRAVLVSPTNGISGPVLIQRVRWGPDDKTILWVYNAGSISLHGISQEDVASGQATDLNIYASDFDIANDGTFAVYRGENAGVHQGKNLLLVSPSGEDDYIPFPSGTIPGPFYLTQSWGDVVIGGSLAWSFDGTQIAVFRGLAARRDGSAQMLGGCGFSVDQDNSPGSTFSWSEDGSRLAFDSAGTIYVESVAAPASSPPSDTCQQLFAGVDPAFRP
jgi:hypothetical protein